MADKQYLKEIFGIDSFRDKQEEVIDLLEREKNILCLMPTGMGKSLIYQYFTILNRKMTIVFSPLVALMGQQRDTLNSQIQDAYESSFAFNSEVNSLKQYKYLRDGFKPPLNPRFLFLSPEKVLTDGYLEYKLKQYKDNIGLVVIDEAHCVSQWGNSFRPAYKMLQDLLQNIFGQSTPPILCLTATINQKDRQEIIDSFDINDVIISDSLYRSNIELNIIPEFSKNEEKRAKLEEILTEQDGNKVIVYNHIKKRDYGTRAMSEYFKNKGLSCAPYDADLSSNEREETLEKFISGEIKIIFATNAFGMGVDIPDIRCVVHYLMPESLEQYYQEVGRAGRDGEKSKAYLLHAEPNSRIKKDQISGESINKEIVLSTWSSLLGKKGEKEVPGYIGQFGYFDNSKKNTELKILLTLVKKGFVSIINKGISKISCFEEQTPNTILSKYLSSTRIGSVNLVSKRTNEDLLTIHNNLFRLFEQNKISLTSSPEKVIFYKVNRPLTDADIIQIIDEFEEIVEFKLKGLIKLIDVLNGEMTINEALSKYLDI